MSEIKRSTEELLKVMVENNQKMDLYKLEADEHGRYLLDSNNAHHRAWMENDDEYEIIEHKE